MAVRRVALLAVTVASVLLPMGPVRAAAAVVTIDSTKPALADKDGGGWTAALGFTNLTTGTFNLVVTPVSTTDSGCMPKAEPSALPAETHTDVTVTLNAGCTVAGNGIVLHVAATAPRSASPAAMFTVSAAPKPKNGVDWDPLRAFPIALLALFLAAVGFFLVWDAADGQDHKVNEPLPYLESTWSFKDSWVSNITVGAALLTGIFGSADVLTALLGTDAKDAVALATVGAAIGAAFVAAGPILLAATKKGGIITVGGLLAASALTLTGAAGELYTVYASARLLDLGGWEDRVYLLAIVAGVLLTVYAVRTVHEVLEQGTTKPLPLPPSDTIIAAKMLVAALQAKTDVDEKQVKRTLGLVAKTYPQIDTEPDDGYRPSRRSALL